MRYFYDTEFIEDGKTIELISLAMIAEDGRELYLISEEISYGPVHKRICTDSWLMENVVKQLPTTWWRTAQPAEFRLNLERNDIVPLRMIKNAVRDFIIEPDRENVELWADYAAYDHVVLCQLFGRMVSLPNNIPMFTHDFQQLWSSKGKPTLPDPPENTHDALADAKYLKLCFESLT